MKKEMLIDWLLNHQCAEFNEDGTATYYVHLTEDGDLTADAGNADTTITETISIDAWAEDDSPERFYEEYETADNADFIALAERIAAKIEEA